MASFFSYSQFLDPGVISISAHFFWISIDRIWIYWISINIWKFICFCYKKVFEQYADLNVDRQLDH